MHVAVTQGLGKRLNRWRVCLPVRFGIVVYIILYYTFITFQLPHCVEKWRGTCEHAIFLVNVN